MKITETTGVNITQIWTQVEPLLEEATSLDEASQALVTGLRAHFDESVVLARVYGTVSFDDLTPDLQAFVQNLAESAGAAEALKGTTPVLSLLGTSGRESAWCDRRTSEGHKGIPLISADFVGGIPMISRLLHELGVPLDWIDTHEAQRIVTTIGDKLGLFHVGDAATEKDDQQRQVIPAQDFVSTYGVKSVFGSGGAYPNGNILVMVLFCSETVERATAEQFLPLAELFRNKTASLVAPGRVFTSG